MACHFLSFEGLQKSFRAYLLLSALLALISSSCRILRKKVDILEDSDREMIILYDSGRKIAILQDSGRKKLSCKILAEKWISCKFLAEKWLSCKFLAEKLVILQISGRMVILEDFGRICQNLAR